MTMRILIVEDDPVCRLYLSKCLEPVGEIQTAADGEAVPRCDAYLTKPIDRADLMFYIKRFGFMNTLSPRE
jgi:CheY-like chemotaxis protein